MATKVLAFDVDAYKHLESDAEFGEEYNNIVPLEDMTPRQRYELALSDDENCLIYDTIDDFLDAMNNGLISEEYGWFYSYNE